MIVVAEGAGSAAEIAAKIKESIDLDPRVTVLGHIQRGGSPTGRDRVNATKMGYLAVELLKAGFDDLQTIWEMQVEAFSQLYEKYHDTETSPATEEIDKIIWRFIFHSASKWNAGL